MSGPVAGGCKSLVTKWTRKGLLIMTTRMFLKLLLVVKKFGTRRTREGNLVSFSVSPEGAVVVGRKIAMLHVTKKLLHRKRCALYFVGMEGAILDKLLTT